MEKQLEFGFGALSGKVWISEPAERRVVVTPDESLMGETQQPEKANSYAAGAGEYGKVVPFGGLMGEVGLGPNLLSHVPLLDDVYYGPRRHGVSGVVLSLGVCRRCGKGEVFQIRPDSNRCTYCK